MLNCTQGKDGAVLRGAVLNFRKGRLPSHGEGAGGGQRRAPVEEPNSPHGGVMICLKLARLLAGSRYRLAVQPAAQPGAAEGRRGGL